MKVNTVSGKVSVRIACEGDKGFTARFVGRRSGAVRHYSIGSDIIVLHNV